jgi:hypothetical protein
MNANTSNTGNTGNTAANGPLHWVKSSLSKHVSNCVEVAALPGPEGGVAVRNSKDPDGAVVKFTAGEWGAFIGGVLNGEMYTFMA